MLFSPNKSMSESKNILSSILSWVQKMWLDTNELAKAVVQGSNLFRGSTQIPLLSLRHLSDKERAEYEPMLVTIAVFKLRLRRFGDLS